MLKFQSVMRINPTKFTDWSTIWSAQTPIIISGVASSWPAISDVKRKWRNFSNIGQNSKNCLVPVEIGQYMDKDIETVQMFFHDLLDYFSLRQTQGETIQPKSEPQVYLAQHDLREIPQLFEDVCPVPDLVLTGKRDLYKVNIWLGGPDGTVSPCHIDPFNNLLCQIIGEKEIILFPPSASNFLYPALGTLQPNTSLVNIENPDPQLHPLFFDPANVGYSATIGVGDGLFIPFKWWHFCKAKRESCSVNFWWL